jgi:hypothetical protein
MLTFTAPTYRTDEGKIDVKAMAAYFGLEQQQVAKFLDLDSSAVSRGAIGKHGQEKLERLDALFERISAFLPKRKDHLSWMRKYNRDLGTSPLQYIETGNLTPLEDYLQAIETGQPD